MSTHLPRYNQLTKSLLHRLGQWHRPNAWRGFCHAAFARRAGRVLVRGVLVGCLATLAACNASLGQLPQSELFERGDARLAQGIKQALEIGSSRAASQLSSPGGYGDSPVYRIGLPENVQGVASTLRQFGLGGYIDKVEALMNKAAEQAASEAQTLFVAAVRNMSIDDALGIVRGDDTAATRYFRAQTEAALRERYAPIIEQHLSQVGFYDQYQSLLSAYRKIPLANKPNLDLEAYALDQSLDGLFKQVAKEEQAIRADPIGRGSQLIGAVFASPSATGP